MTFFRPATLLRDVPRMADILQGWAGTMPWMPNLHTRGGIARFLGRLPETTKITLSGDAAGAGRLSLDRQEVDAPDVAGDARGIGAGSIPAAPVQALRARRELRTFPANRSARVFHTGHGFRDVDRTDCAGNEKNLPDVRLEWSRA